MENMNPQNQKKPGEVVKFPITPQIRASRARGTWDEFHTALKTVKPALAESMPKKLQVGEERMEFLSTLGTKELMWTVHNDPDGHIRIAAVLMLPGSEALLEAARMDMGIAPLAVYLLSMNGIVIKDVARNTLSGGHKHPEIGELINAWLPPLDDGRPCPQL